jgi:hypothetical protein
MITKHPSPEGGVTHTYLPCFLIAIARNEKALESLNLTTLYNIVRKADAY